jgi:hypothetical protein
LNKKIKNKILEFQLLVASTGHFPLSSLWQNIGQKWPHTTTSQGVGQPLEPLFFLHFKVLSKKIEILLFFYLLQINIFLMISYHFDVLISKIIFKK